MNKGYTKFIYTCWIAAVCFFSNHVAVGPNRSVEAVTSSQQHFWRWAGMTWFGSEAGWCLGPGHCFSLLPGYNTEGTTAQPNTTEICPTTSSINWAIGCLPTPGLVDFAIPFVRLKPLDKCIWSLGRCLMGSHCSLKGFEGKWVLDEHILYWEGIKD